jgi:ABC-type antimicrobial peptide transport system permease subunit
MSSDFFYNFSNKIDNEDESLKLNLDELYNKKQQQDLNVLNNYNKILQRIHNKIKFVSKNIVNDNCCWYLMPEMVIGVPKYDYKDCTAYTIDKLRANGFIVRYTHPNLLFISWKHWVPTYVRNEIKKKTGNVVDEYGNIINNDDKNTNITSAMENKDANDNLLFSNNKQVKNVNTSSNKEYKDIKSYKPSGNLIYNNSLLEKLQIN